MISVIVPVYNVGKYLDKCIQSILAQSYTNWQLLLIDDGSQDESGLICDKYAKTYQRIKVFHTANGGVSHARNIGLDKAQGEWIMFVDADDYLTTNCLQMCVDIVEKEVTDIVQFSIVCMDEKSIPLYYMRKESRQTDLFTYAKTCDNYSFSACAALLSRSVIEQNRLRFDPSLTLGEDQLFMINYLNHCRLLTTMSDVCYNYLFTQDNFRRKINASAVLRSLNRFILLKQEVPLFASQCDRTIVDYVVQLLAYTHYPISSIAQLFEVAHIKGPIVRRAHRWLVRACKINIIAPLWVTRIVLNKKYR